MKIRSKICGIREPADLKAISSMYPDYLGFIFYDRSKRFMKETLSASDLAAVSDMIAKVGVFVNEEISIVKELVDEYGLDAVQIHGDEAPDYMLQLRAVLPDQILILKAFGIDPSFDWLSLNDYQDCCDVFLFDTKTANYGGSGRRFDIKLLSGYQLDKPVMMSGGIGIEDIADILTETGFRLWGIDMNSQLETAPGKKDLQLVERALKTIKHYEHRE